MISINHKGSFKKTKTFFAKSVNVRFVKIFEKYGEIGVSALSRATPSDTGMTARSWGYSIDRSNGGATLTWTNSNVQNGVPIAILIQYGHATKNGGYVRGIDFINPALKPIFEKITKDLWKEVKEL